MNSKRNPNRWPVGVSTEDFPGQAQEWAEQHANDPAQPERYEDDLPALRELAQLTSWRQSLRDLWDLLRGRS